jgi:hypothetical protein
MNRLNYQASLVAFYMLAQEATALPFTNNLSQVDGNRVVVGIDAALQIGPTGFDDPIFDKTTENDGASDSEGPASNSEDNPVVPVDGEDDGDDDLADQDTPSEGEPTNDGNGVDNPDDPEDDDPADGDNDGDDNPDEPTTPSEDEPENPDVIDDCNSPFFSDQIPDI